MAIQTRSELIDALKSSGLFAAEQLAAMCRELDSSNDLRTAMRFLIESGRLTMYQLRKVVNGKAGELLLGDFVISAKLGEGGMGKVYRARHKRLGREVALKVIRPHLLANPVIRGRYEREVKAASALRHPNIVAVEDAGESDGKTWLALEFVNGLDLSRLVRDHGLLAVPEACEYIRQAALGLQHAHDLGFVHRDIKPSNIIVSGERHVAESRTPCRVKILDMGLVRGGFDDGDGGLDLTRAGTVVGTPDYMAPEQARNSSTVDHRADLYALGCSFYLLLTGKPPFPTGTAIDKLLKHQTEPPRPLQAERPDVPTGLAAVVAKLLAKKPEQRFGTATAVADALLPFAQGAANRASVVVNSDPPGIDAAAETLVPPPPTVPGDSPDEAPSPFEFPVEALRSDSPKSQRTVRPTPVHRPQPSRMWLVLTLLGVALAVGVLAVWLAMRNRTAPPPPATETPKAVKKIQNK